MWKVLSRLSDYLAGMGSTMACIVAFHLMK